MPEAGEWPTIVSCDVFDTLLLRDLSCETDRFAAVAHEAVGRIAAQSGIAVDVEAVLLARLAAHHFAYRALDALHPGGEVRFGDLADAMASILGLGPAGAAIIADAEIAVEASHLRPNHQLIAWLRGQAAAGVRIIAVSDTWHDAQTIAYLLDRVAPGNPVAAIYTSADCDATKRRAGLFRHVLATEGVGPDQILHIGDDAVADEAQARAAGLRTKRVVRSGFVRFGRRTGTLWARMRRPVPLH
ncbi:HAD family hydrolase [Methylobacterium sp. JK268]